MTGRILCPANSIMSGSWIRPPLQQGPHVRIPTLALQRILGQSVRIFMQKDPTLTPKIAKSVRLLDPGSQPIFQGPGSAHPTQEIGNIVHSDVWGPAPVHALGGALYAVSYESE